MKKYIIFLFIVLKSCGMAYGQISGQMRIGYNSDYGQGMISPSVDFAAHKIHLSTEMIINPARDKPVSFGAKLGYEFTATETVSIKFGAGRYFNMYSTDDYDKYRNEWVNLYFTAIHWKKWFIEYDYINGSVFSVGVRELISNIN